jgi:hypothetical protein
MDGSDDSSDIASELEAMKQIGGALAPLDEDARKRVLLWAGDRFGIEISNAPRDQKKAPNEDHSERETRGHTAFPDSFAEFFARLDPQTDPDRALAAAYWFRKQEGRVEFSAFDVNAELTQLGHKVGNITKALGSLIGRKPQLILQKGKAGKSQQARKTYAISHAGEKEIEQKLTGVG